MVGSEVRDPIDQLDDAVVDGDWPRALEHAIEVWRTTRATEIADLVDRIAERCTPPSPPHTRAAHHRWWMELAKAPDPVTLGGLLATLPIRLHVTTDVTWQSVRERWPRSNPIIAAIAALPVPLWMRRQDPEAQWPTAIPSWIERLAALIEWPDDPRLTRTLLELLSHPEIVFASATNAVCRALADRLAALGDRRALPALDRLAAITGGGRQLAVAQLVPEIRAILFNVPERVIDPRVARMLPRVPQTPHPAVDVEPLWRQIVERPDDIEPRLILADALLGIGDSRGELISLQCALDPERRGAAEARANRLIRTEWHRWFGELAQLLARRGTVIRRGMLEEIRVGLHSTPPSVWATAARHHELAAVRAVRPAQAPPERYAELVAGLSRSPETLGIADAEVIVALDRLRGRLAATTIEYAPVKAYHYDRRPIPPFGDTFDRLARLAPDVEVLDLGWLWWIGGELHWANLDAASAVALLSRLPHAFPRLRAIRVVRGRLDDAVAARLAAVPLVEVVGPTS